MKRFTIVTILVVFMLWVGLAQADLVGYWPLDGDPNDASGNEYDGIIRGTATFVEGKDGIADTAMAFDGISNYVDLNEHAASFANIDDITIAAWVKGYVSDTSGDCVFGITDGSSTNRFQLELYTGAIVFGLQYSGYWWTSLQSPAQTWDPDTWYHIAWMNDGGTRKIFKDGILLSSDGEGVGTNALASVTKMSIGALQFSTALNIFKGSIDEVRLYDHALSQAELYEIADIDNGAPEVNAGLDAFLTYPEDTAQLDATVSDDGIPGTGLILQWSKVDGPGTVTFTPSDDIEDPQAQFSATGSYTLMLQVSDGIADANDFVNIVVYAEDETGLLAWYKLDNDANDYSGNDYDGSIVGSLTPVEGYDETPNGAFSFAPGNYVDLSSQIGYFEDLSSFTMTCWVKGYSGQSGQILFSITDPTGANRVQIELHNNTIGWDFCYSGSWLAAYSTVQTWDTNTWYHIAIVNDSGIRKAYVNAIEVLNNNIGITVADLSGLVKMAIGALDIGTIYGTYLTLDDVRIYERPLTVPELADLAGQSNVCPEKLDADINGDCYINLDDFAIIVASWLECNDQLNPDCN